MTTLEHKQELLATIASDLRAEGYDVYLMPLRHQLPSALADLRPDAVALGTSKNLLIEVFSAADPRSTRLETLRSRLKGVAGWELRVFYVRPDEGSQHVKLTPPGEIANSLDSIRRLARSGFTGPALLLGWATLEAVARKHLPSIFARPQTPGRIIEVLAGRGDLTPTEAASLRGLAEKRNQLVHGDLTVSVAEQEISGFVDVLEILLKSNSPPINQRPNESRAP